MIVKNEHARQHKTSNFKKRFFNACDYFVVIMMTGLLAEMLILKNKRQSEQKKDDILLFR